MILALPLIALIALAPRGGIGGETASDVARGIDDWIAVDDPDLSRIPTALRFLPNEEQAVYESAKKPWILIARRVSLVSDAVAAFAEDEKVMSKRGKFVPVDEDYMEIRGGEAAYFECEWELKGHRSRILAVYAPAEGDALHVLWIIAPESDAARKLRPELKACLRDLRKSLKPPTEATYGSILNGHALSFALRTGRGRNTISLESIARPNENDAAFFEHITAKHKHLHTAISRNWRDDNRDLDLSYQIYQTDTALGPKAPVVHWLAEQLQVFVRRNKDDGDVPVELLHIEDARTSIVSAEEVAHHYGNNRRAPDAGVILRTFLPRSPYARACRLRWTDEKTGRPSLALFVELRTYPRSRSETVARTSVVMLLARAGKQGPLDAFETDLEFTSRPLEDAAPLGELPH